jgi:hypothetical protein
VDVPEGTKKMTVKSLNSKFKKILKTTDENTAQLVSDLAREALESGWTDLEIQSLINSIAALDDDIETGGNND